MYVIPEQLEYMHQLREWVSDGRAGIALNDYLLWYQGNHVRSLDWHNFVSHMYNTYVYVRPSHIFDFDVLFQ